MKKFINNVKADRLTYRGFIISFLFLLFTVIYIGVYFSHLPPFIPIFNQLPWGNDRLTPTIGIFIPVAVYFVFLVFNLIFTSVVYAKNPLIGRIIAATTLLIAVMNFIFIIKTVTLII